MDSLYDQIDKLESQMERNTERERTAKKTGNPQK